MSEGVHSELGRQKEILLNLRALSRAFLYRGHKVCTFAVILTMPCTRRQFAKTALLSAAVSGGLSSNLFGQAPGSFHIVRKGDTLSHLAIRYGTSVSELKRANSLTSDVVRIGQKLTIPGSTQTIASESNTIHVVQKGDTLGHIAVRYGVSVGAIKQANGLSSDLVRIDQKLKIPTSTGSAPLLDQLSAARAATAKINVRRDNWRRIVVHHSAIKYGNAKKYDAAHRQRGMQNGLAYHFVIGNGIDSSDGQIEVGPRWTKQLLGGHVKSYKLNLTAIGICLVGNFEETHPSRKQLDAFTQLMDWLQRDALRKKVEFAGHRELKGEQTICPGKNFPLATMHARFG